MKLIPIYTNSPTPQQPIDNEPTIVMVDRSWGQEVTVWDEPGEGMDTRLFLMLGEVLKEKGRIPDENASPQELLADLAQLLAEEAGASPESA